MPIPRQIAAAKAREMRGLIRDIRGYLENLGLYLDPSDATKARSSDGTTVIRTRAGKLIATFGDPSLADFFHRSGSWLLDLMNHVEYLEQVAYEQRVERRKLRDMADALYNAHAAGLNTSTGKYQLDRAIQILRDPNYGKDD